MSLDALVLLGCRVGAEGLSPPAERRARRAAQAFHDGLAPLVVVSGGRRWQGVCEADALSAELERLNVPAGAIVRERRSLFTRENAAFSAELLRERGLGRAGVVTCDWHLPRALVCFARTGLDARGVAAVSPRVPRHEALLRGARETLGLWLDRTLTWGWRAG